MARYVPSGKFSPAGMVTIVCIGILSSVLVGAGMYFVGKAFYLILIFPMIWGLAVGAALGYGVKVGKCRSAGLAAVVAVVSGTLSYGAYHELRNRDIREMLQGSLERAVRAKRVDLKGTSPAQAYQKWLEAETGQRGFWGEVAFRAKAGMNISHNGSPAGRGGAPLIRGVGMYVYWAIEWIVIAGLAATVPVVKARQVFCEGCQEWYGRIQLATLKPERIPEVSAALTRREFQVMGSFVGPGTAGYLMLEKCPSCDVSALNVIVESTVRDRRGRETRKAVYQDLLTREEANALVAAVSPARPSPPAPGLPA